MVQKQYPKNIRSFISQNSTNQQTGFTLVELAIVLMIVGLLIGGVLRGQELLENAKVTGTIQQVKSYQGATATFLESYNNYPGDMSSATTKIPNCTGSNFCLDGDGNGMVGQFQHDFIPRDAGVENIQFWKHLALAHLITGVNPSANPATPNVGTTNPISKYNGGFMVSYNQSNDPARPTWNGLFLLMVPSTLTQAGEDTAGNVEGKWSVSPRIAAQIDRKMDDGDPATGDVMSADAGYAPLSGRCEAPYPYDETSNVNNCIPIFRLK